MVIILSTVLINNSLYAQGSFPLEVTVVTTQVTLPTTISEFLDAYETDPNFLFISVRNTTMQNKRYKLLMELHNQEQNFRIIVEDTEILECLSIDGQSTEQMGENEIRSLFDLNNIDIVGSNIEFSDLLIDPTLGEGHYTICMWATECDNVEEVISDRTFFGSCAEFQINYPDPPIINTICNQTFEADIPSINISWLFFEPAGFSEDIDYDVRIFELDPDIPVDPNELDFQIPPTYSIVVTNSKQVTLLNGDDIVLHANKQYAVRVRATGLGLNVKNNGYSEVCIFYVFDDLSNAYFTLEQHYPTQNRPVYFNRIPLVFQITPNCEDELYEEIENYSYIMNISDGSIRKNWSKRLSWNGPTATQRRILNICNGTNQVMNCGRSSLIAHNNPNENLTLKRGEHYFANLTGTIRYSIRGTDRTQPFGANVSFDAGMGKPVFSLPTRNDTFQRRKPIRITFTTTPPAERLGPDFDLRYTNPETNSTCSTFDDQVFEQWHLQISKTRDFSDDIVVSRWEKIGSLTDQAFSFKSMYNQVTGEKLEDRETDIINAFSKQVIIDLDSLPTGSYYARVTWATNPEDTLVEDNFYRVSDVLTFFVKDTVRPKPPADECIVTCEPVAPRISVPQLLSVNDTFSIAGFKVIVKKITRNNVDGYNGEGEVSINFLHSFKLKTKFKDITVNSGDTAMTGLVEGLTDVDLPYDSLRKNGKIYYKYSEASAEAIHAAITTGQRFIQLYEDIPTKLPIGYDHTIGDVKITLGLTKVIISPQKGILQAMTVFKEPDLANFWFSAGANICINPNGYADSLKFFVPNDIGLLDEGPNTTVYISGVENADNEMDQTYFSWNCEKDFRLNIAGKIHFSRDEIVPEKPDGSIDQNENNKVKASFGVNVFLDHTNNNHDWGWIFRVNIPKFQFVDHEGWSFGVTNAYLDRSSISNPPSFVLPPNYDYPGIDAPATMNLWKGVYIQELSVTSPEGMIGDDQRTSFVVNNLLRDRQGFTASLLATNLVDFGDNRANGGWGITLDTFQWKLQQNTTNLFRLKGQLTCPAFEEDDRLTYQGSYERKIFKDRDDNDSIVKYLSFLVEPSSDLHFPIAGAAINLDDTSVIQLTKNTAINKWEFECKLSGFLDLSNIAAYQNLASRVPKLKMGIRVEGFKMRNFALVGQTEIKFASASDDKKMGDFPLTLDTMYVQSEGGFLNTHIQGTLSLTGSENAISGTASMIIKSKMGGSIRKFMIIEDVSLDSIAISANLPVVDLDGYIKWIKNGPQDGLKGRVNVVLPMDISGFLELEFGTNISNPSAAFNTSGNYSYWRILAAIHLPNPVTVIPGFDLHSIGGGVYYHMQKVGINYSPSFDTRLGIELLGRFATQGDKETFNMDINLSGEVNNSGGLANLRFRGDGWCMQSFSNADPFGSRVEEPKIWGNIDISYVLATSTLSGNIDFFVHQGDQIQGGMATQYKAGRAQLHVDPSIWFFYIGTQDDRNYLKIKLGVTLDVRGYFMVGHNIPGELPPPPQALLEILAQGVNSGSNGGMDVINNTLSNNRETSILSSGRGIAFGASVDVNVPEFTFLILYAKLRFVAGMDIVLVNTDEEIICANTGGARGINNWYAQGQLYAGIEGELGIRVKLWKTYKISLVELAAGIIMKAGGPNPSYFFGMGSVYYSVLNGMVSGRSSFSVQVGKVCELATGDALDGLRILADLKPKTSASIFDLPTASFYFPVNVKIDLPVTDGNGNVTGIESFYPVLHSFELKDSINNLINGNTVIADDNLSAVLSRSNVLDPFKTYLSRIVIRARKGSINGAFATRTNGTIWEEIKTASFKTGGLPSEIPIDQVKYSTPLPFQRYFLKNEVHNNSAFLTFQQALNPFFYRYKDVVRSGSTFRLHYKYFIRIIGGSDTIKSEISTGLYNGFVLSGVDQLSNSRKYKMQLIRSVYNVENRINNRNLMYNDWAMTADVNRNGPLALQYSDTRVHAVANVQGGVLNDAVVVNPQEVFFNLYFKTSRYNTLAEKSHPISNATSLYYPSSSIRPDYYRVFTFWNELPDETDVLPFNGISPKLRFSNEPSSNIPPGTSSYKRDFINPYLLNLVRDINGKVVSGTCRQPNKPVEIERSYTISVNSGNADPLEIPYNMITGYKLKFTFSEWNRPSWMADDLPTDIAIDGGSGSQPSYKSLLVKYGSNLIVLNKAVTFNNLRLAEWRKLLVCSITVGGAFRNQYSSINQRLLNWVNYPNIYPWAYNYICNKSYPIEHVYRKYTLNGSNPILFGNGTNSVTTFQTITCPIID